MQGNLKVRRLADHRGWDGDTRPHRSRSPPPAQRDCGARQCPQPALSGRPASSLPTWGRALQGLQAVHCDGWGVGLAGGGPDLLTSRLWAWWWRRCGPDVPGGGAGGGLRAQVVELVAAHGGQSAAEAEVTVTRWAREKRYLQDIWS